MKSTSLQSSSQQSELNALAPLRVGGLAQAIIDHKHEPDKVESLARELLALVPDILEMLVVEGEKTPALV